MAWHRPFVGALRALARRRRSRYNQQLEAHLHLRELERRRVLSANFSLGPGGLSLANFSQQTAESLTVAQVGNQYQFALSEGTWTNSGGNAGGITGDGTSTIHVPITEVQSPGEGILVDAVVGANSDGPRTGINVTLQTADFSTLLGPLSITTEGSIFDAPGTQFNVGSDIDFRAAEITLADSAGDSFTVEGDATFVTFFDGDISLGADAANFNSTVQLGTLSFSAGFGRVRVVEDGTATPSEPFTMTVVRRDFDNDKLQDPNQGGTVQLRTTGGGIQLDSLVARNLWVDSAGAIIDHRPDSAIIVDDGFGGGDALFEADGTITLADQAANQLRVGGHATFVTLGDENIDVGVNPAQDFADSGGDVRLGTLSFSAGFGRVRVVEDGTATPSEPFTMTVVRRDFDNDKFQDPNQGGVVRLRTTGGGIRLDSLVARNLWVDSAGAIVDHQPDTAIVVDDGFGGGDALFAAEGPITLADQAANQLRVVGHATFVTLGDENIDVGVDPIANFADSGGDVRLGTLSFSAGFGRVRVVEDGTATLSEPFTMTVVRRDFDNDKFQDPNQGGAVRLRTTGGGIQLDSLVARDLWVDSAGAIVDHQPDVVILVDDGFGGGDALFQANGPITLAQDPGDVLRVNRLATFAAVDRDGTLRNIDVGPSGVVNFGRLNLRGQTVTVQEDSSTELTGVLARELTLDSTGNITDVPQAPITILQYASLGAGIDIVLGDKSAVFEFPDLQLFEQDRYLAIAARHASLQLQGDVNLLSELGGNADRSVITNGTLFISATGSIAQIGRGTIQANEAAFVSDAAIVLTGIDIGSLGATGTSHHFAAIARGAINVERSVPSEAIPEQLPRSASDALAPFEVQFVANAEGQLVPVLGKRTVGDNYGLIVTGVGDVTVGHVADPTLAQAAIDGIVVTQGNSYLEAKASNGMGGGEVARVGEAGDLLFTAQEAASPQIVNAGNYVFTAVADGELVIDGPNSTNGVFTALVSATGVVTSVGPFSTFDGRFPDQPTVTKIGPRMILTPPSLGPQAPTSAVVTPPEFIQRIEIAYGSTGEFHFIVEIVWADVQNPPNGPPLPPSVPGTIPLPEVIDLPTPAATRSFAHQFAPLFLEMNPSFPNLPTSIRLFNDPLINLFSSGGARDLNQTTSLLGSGPEFDGGFVTPVFQTTVPPPPDFSPPNTVRETSQDIERYPVREVAPIFRATRHSRRDTSLSELRRSSPEQVETVVYGPVRVDESGKVVWVETEDGSWPRTWDKGRAGYWIENIQQQVNRGAWDLGQKFQIRTKTGSREQVEVEWQFVPPNVDALPPPTDFDKQELPGDSSSSEPIPAAAPALPVGEVPPASTEAVRWQADPTEGKHSFQIGSLATALALVRLSKQRQQERATPQQVAEELARVEHQDLSSRGRRRRLGRRLHDIVSS